MSGERRRQGSPMAQYFDLSTLLFTLRRVRREVNACKNKPTEGQMRPARSGYPHRCRPRPDRHRVPLFLRIRNLRIPL